MSKPTSRKEQERENRRRLMLDAALAVFAERGYKQATIDEIAQRSEFAKGTIYNYFPGGKDEILFAILDDVYDGLYELSVRVFNERRNGSFAETLTKFIEAFLDYFLSEVDLFVIILKETNRIAFGDDPGKATYFKDRFRQISGVLEPEIELAMQSGELKPFGVKTVANVILGNVHGFLRYHCLERVGEGGIADCEPPTAARAAAFMSEMLLYGLAEPTTQKANGHGETKAESKE